MVWLRFHVVTKCWPPISCCDSLSTCLRCTPDIGSVCRNDQLWTSVRFVLPKPSPKSKPSGWWHWTIWQSRWYSLTHAHRSTGYRNIPQPLADLEYPPFVRLPYSMILLMFSSVIPRENEVSVHDKPSSTPQWNWDTMNPEKFPHSKWNPVPSFSPVRSSTVPLQ
jgi:hypothetical protein